MKRFVAVCTLILCVSFPALAGHTTPGYGWCECDSLESHSVGLRVDDETQESKELTQRDQDDELETILSAVLLWLRLIA